MNNADRKAPLVGILVIMGIGLFVGRSIVAGYAVDAFRMVTALFPLLVIGGVILLGGWIVISIAGIFSSGIRSTQIMNIGGPVKPERSRGAVYVYRRHTVNVDPDGDIFIDGARGGDWGKWQLEADEAPTMENTNGIYGCHDPNDPELDCYKNGHTILCRVELRGQRVLHSRGSRGQFGRVVEVLSAEGGIVTPSGVNLNKWYNSPRYKELKKKGFKL